MAVHGNFPRGGARIAPYFPPDSLANCCEVGCGSSVIAPAKVLVMPPNCRRIVWPPPPAAIFMISDVTKIMFRWWPMAGRSHAGVLPGNTQQHYGIDVEFPAD